MGLKSTIIESLVSVLTKKERETNFACWENLYGSFDQTDYNDFLVTDLPSESGVYHGEIIKWVSDLQPKSILFAGENRATVLCLKDIMQADEVYTTGLSDTDYPWDFEKTVPQMEKNFNFVISQAILEHLINPYKHIVDRSLLLNDGLGLFSKQVGM